MIYDLNNDIEVERCRKRFKSLLARKAKVEVKEAKKNRSLDQNAYYHKLIQILADDICDSFESVKFDSKIELGFYIESRQGNKIPESTATMSSKRMTELIDRFRMWAESFHVVYLPTPEEYWKGLE